MKTLTKNDLIGLFLLGLFICLICVLVYADSKGTLSNLNSIG